MFDSVMSKGLHRLLRGCAVVLVRGASYRFRSPRSLPMSFIQPSAPNSDALTPAPFCCVLVVHGGDDATFFSVCGLLPLVDFLVPARAHHVG